MKKITFLLLLSAALPKVFAQCDAPVMLPYTEGFEQVTVPALPECMLTGWEAFSSQEVFKSIDGVPGFTGKLLAYDTTINTEFGMPASAPVRANLSTPDLELVQGMAYTVSFRYANSSPENVIDMLSLSIQSMGAYTDIDVIEDITGAVPQDYVSLQFTPPSTGVYRLNFTVDSEGTQGLLYLDDITIEMGGLMDAGDAAFSGFSLYPNPAKDTFTVENNAAIDSVELYSSTGQLVTSVKPAAVSATVDVSPLASGIYFAGISSAGQTKRFRVVKQ